MEKAIVKKLIFPIIYLSMEILMQFDLFRSFFPHAFYLLQMSWESFTTHSSKSISKIAGGNAEYLTVRTDAKPDFI